VIGILGVIAAVVVPNVGSFIGRGKSESYETELHNIQTSTMAMLTDSTTSVLGGTTPLAEANATKDLSTVVTTDTTPLVLSDYITGLGDDPDTDTVVETTCTTTGCTYWFDSDGTTHQITP
jgi:type II secretory pathway pseudopilin PulG